MKSFGPPKISNFMQGLKSAILAIFQKSADWLKWPCSVSYIPPKKYVYIPEEKTFTSPKQTDVYIPEAKNTFTSLKQKSRLHSPNKKDIFIPKDFYTLKEKEVYILEAKRHLDPRKKNIYIPEVKSPLTSPKQKDVYIPEEKRHLHPRSKKTFISPKQKRRLHP